MLHYCGIRALITQDELKLLLSYNSETGDFTNLVSRSGMARIGKIAGFNRTGYYSQIGLNGKLYYTHRLVWLYVYGYFPKLIIDHINGDKGDNRLSNLRLASISQNAINQKKLQRNNTSGYKGVSWSKKSRKWRAGSTVNGKTVTIGYFDDVKEAANAYQQFASLKHGDFHNNLILNEVKDK